MSLKPYDEIVTMSMDILMKAEFGVDADGDTMSRYQWGRVANAIEWAANKCRVAVESNVRVKTIAPNNHVNFRMVLRQKFTDIKKVYPDCIGDLVARMYNFAARRALTSRRE